MFWQWVDRLTSLSFLLLATILVSNLSLDKIENDRRQSFLAELNTIKNEISKSLNSNVVYLEGRVNGVAKTQDEYELSTTARVAALETRVLMVEKENNNKSL